MRQKRVLLCVAALALVGVGCASTTVNTLENADAQGERQAVRDNRVATDGSLNRKARVVGLTSATAPNGIMRLQVEVMNLSRGAQTFFYNLEWFDLNGMQVTTAGAGWTERQVMGREITTILVTAPSPACKDFRLKLIEKPR